MHHNKLPLLQCPILEASATALCGTTGIYVKIYNINDLAFWSREDVASSGSSCNSKRIWPFLQGIFKALGFLLPGVPSGTPKAGRLSVCCRISTYQQDWAVLTCSMYHYLWRFEFVDTFWGRMVIHGILVDFEVSVPIAGTFFWYLRLVFLQMQLQSSARVCPTNIADERGRSQNHTKAPRRHAHHARYTMLHHRNILTTKQKSNIQPMILLWPMLQTVSAVSSVDHKQWPSYLGDIPGEMFGIDSHL